MAQLTWNFPLPRTHTGVLLGNGTMGLMVWGDEALHLTVGRAGFWDHRGGNDFASRATYEQVSDILHRGDSNALRRLFAVPQSGPDQPGQPTQLGLGRVEIRFPAPYRPHRAHLDTNSGVVEIEVGNDGGQQHLLTLALSMDQELAWLSVPPALRPLQVRLRPSWEWIASAREPLGMPPPQVQGDDRAGAMQQCLPEDAPAALAYAMGAEYFLLSTALGAESLNEALGRLDESQLEEREQQRRQWWHDYERCSAQASFPDQRVQEIWDYGLYKQACLTTPTGVAATLQGPWLEEYQIPPWSCDYHFNINLEMVYWPCLATGHPQHLTPLWDLLESWLPQLRAAGRSFFRSDEALMLPHAVDDRCRTVGTFWTGCIDSACTAWMAQLAWHYYRHTADREFLRRLAWPLLHGAFGAYWSMCERGEDGSLSLPVSVSPEFKGARDDAWGRNASFQLAACHFLARALPQAAADLGMEVDPRWQEVSDRLPLYSAGEYPNTREYPEHLRSRLELWQGQDLVESHRHHSHLGAIYPFATIDPQDPAHHEVVANSIYHWVRSGPGAWSGWCVPWAAILHARCGHGDGALGWLHFWQEHFTNEGRGTLHDARFFGATTLYQQGSGAAGEKHSQEIMQIEAGQGALTALCELLLQQRGAVLHVYPAPVRRWSTLRFSGLHAEGGFVLGAEIADGCVQQVSLHSQRGGSLQLAHGLGEHWLRDDQRESGPLLHWQSTPGETLCLRRSQGGQ